MKTKILTLIAGASAFALPTALANHIDFIVDGGFSISNMGGEDPTTDIQTGDGENILGSEREVTLMSDLDTMNASLFNAPVAGTVGEDNSSFIGVTADSDSIGTLTLLYDGVGSIGLNDGAGSDFDTTWNF